MGTEIGAIFFDFKKAFDTVPHLPLLEKLEQLGLDPCIVTWIHNYLAERRQAVVLNGASSQSAHVISGVPQGSILGPLLFLIYIDDITHANISEASKLFMPMTFCYTVLYPQRKTMWLFNLTLMP